MKLTRKAFETLFGVHLPPTTPSVWFGGVKYSLVDGKDEIAELERLLEVCQ